MLNFKFNLDCLSCGLGGSIKVSSLKVKVGTKLKFGDFTRSHWDLKFRARCDQKLSTRKTLFKYKVVGGSRGLVYGPILGSL